MSSRASRLGALLSFFLIGFARTARAAEGLVPFDGVRDLDRQVRLADAVLTAKFWEEFLPTL